MKTPIIGTGLSGLVGSRVVELLSNDFEFTDLSFTTGVDITQREEVAKHIKNSPANWVIHMAAKANVDACEADKSLGEQGNAWKINVEGTRNIVEIADSLEKRVLYISTDFVFDGRKEKYTEEDQPNPVNWYAQTKYEGEKITLTSKKNLVIRLAYPYRAKNTEKKDFVHAIVAQLAKNTTVSAITDHVFTPTFIDDISQALKTLITQNASGIYHVVGSSFLTAYEAALAVSHIFGYSSSLVRGVSREKYYQNRAPRPFKLSLTNAKITKLGIKMRTFNEGLEEVKKQGIV